MTPGDLITLFNGSGAEYQGNITQISNRQVSVRIGALSRTESESPLEISLLIGISRGERFDYALQKSVELGVSRLYPLFTQRCMVKLTAKRQSQRMLHWHKIVQNACEQSGRCRLPHLEEPKPFATLLDSELPGCLLLLDPDGSSRLSDITPSDSKISLLVGPEGGLTQAESEMAGNRGFSAVSLGPRILRTETAPLAAMAAIQTLWGDF
jgi:16S rRNA (uracil1498-N3)-methyltransferase